jgi:predicted nucleotidyltransferase component of viral defense system
MGQKTILTPTQKKLLDLVSQETYLNQHFYWTGGTVLAEIYLHHRESEDIDLFSETEIHQPSIDKFVSIAGSVLKVKSISHRQFLGLHTYFFKWPKQELKIDFNYYPFPRINIGKKWNQIAVDSLEDIAVNKVHTISTKARDRDFVDLFFIMQAETFSLKRLINLAKAKFDWHIDPVQLGQVFNQVASHKDVPRMLVPFNRTNMETFFLSLAKSLEKDIFKN